MMCVARHSAESSIFSDHGGMDHSPPDVIVPIGAAALADASRLVRVIVAKPQSKQMFQMLVSKLGGLLRQMRSAAFVGNA